MNLVVVGLLVCISRAPNDGCIFHEPETGVGHVAYSESLGFSDLARESINECESVHGDGACDVVCWVSREFE